LIAARPRPLWALIAPWAEPLWARGIARRSKSRGIARWPRPLPAESFSSTRAAWAIGTIATGWAAARGTLVAARPARWARSATTISTIKSRSARRSARLLPPCRIHLPTIAASSLLRSAGQHPALAALGHIAPGQVHVATKGIESTGTASSAASATRSLAAAAAARPATTATATATAARPATAATATAAIPIAATAATTAIIAARVASRFRPRHQIDHVVKFALLLRVGRRILARQDAHQAHSGGALAGDRKCFHQTRQAITLDAHRRSHGLSLGAGAEIRRGRFDGRLGRRLAGWLGRCLDGWLAARFRLRCTLLSRRGLRWLRLAGALFRARGCCLGLGLGARRRLGDRLGSFLNWGMCGSICLLCLCGLSQKNPGELGDRLHERVLRVIGGPRQGSPNELIGLS